MESSKNIYLRINNYPKLWIKFIDFLHTCCTFAIRYIISPFDTDMLYTLYSYRKILFQKHFLRHVLHGSDEENPMISERSWKAQPEIMTGLRKVSSLFIVFFLLPIHTDPSITYTQLIFSNDPCDKWRFWHQP